jgi:hypothetical protein
MRVYESIRVVNTRLLFPSPSIELGRRLLRGRLTATRLLCVGRYNL